MKRHGCLAGRRARLRRDHHHRRRPRARAGLASRPAASPSCRSCAVRPARPAPTWSSAATTSSPTPLVKKAEALAAAGVRAGPAGRRARRRAGGRRGRAAPGPTGAAARRPTAAALARRDLARVPRPARPGPGGGRQRRPPPSRAPTPHPAHADLGRAGRPLLDGRVACCRRARCTRTPRSPPGARTWTSPRRPAPGCPRWTQLAPRPAACRTRATTARPARRWSSRCWRRCSRMRNLRVRTGPAINLLGGGDGANLADPAANAAKAASKQRVLAETLGYAAAGHHPHRLRRRHRRLQDRLGPGHLRRASSARGCGWSSPGTAATPRSPRRWCSTWPGSTAPRTAAGRVGPLPELAFFFKDPLGDVPHALADAVGRLLAALRAPGWRMADERESGRDLAELVRAPGRASVPGDVVAGAAAAGALGRRTPAWPAPRSALLGRHGRQRLGRPGPRRGRAPRAADPVGPDPPRRALGVAAG